MTTKTPGKLTTILGNTVLALFIYMPFHLFLSRWLSTYTGGLMLWEVGKDIVTLLALAISVYLFFQEKLFTNKYVSWLTGLITVYGLLHLVYLFDGSLDRRAVIMGTLYNLRFFIWLFIGYIAGKTNPPELIHRCLRIIAVTSVIVAAVGFLQYFLPKDLMEHFGYSIERGAKPSFFIDDKPDFPRVMSTIRDPNSLGAFLVLPITMFWLRLYSSKDRQRRTLYTGAFTLCILAMLLAFSRSALVGTMIALTIATILNFKQIIFKLLKRFAIPMVVGLVILVSLLPIVYRSYTFQNLVLHSDQKTVEADPNEKRVQVQTLAVKEIIRHPFGHAPGTAGLIAISNTKGGLITENYYLQIGYETGIPGLFLYLTLLYLVYRLICSGKKLSEEQIVLIGSFWAYAFIGLLIHLWSNESVSLQFWLLSGLTIANITTESKASRSYNG